MWLFSFFKHSAIQDRNLLTKADWLINWLYTTKSKSCKLYCIIQKGRRQRSSVLGHNYSLHLINVALIRMWKETFKGKLLKEHNLPKKYPEAKKYRINRKFCSFKLGQNSNMDMRTRHGLEFAALWLLNLRIKDLLRVRDYCIKMANVRSTRKITITCLIWLVCHSYAVNLEPTLHWFLGISLNLWARVVNGGNNSVAQSVKHKQRE